MIMCIKAQTSYCETCYHMCTALHTPKISYASFYIRLTTSPGHLDGFRNQQQLVLYASMQKNQ